MIHSFLFLALMAAGPAEAKKLVLLTAFEPFGGRAQNGSELVARELDGRTIDGVEYKVCLLPVEYDRAASVAKACYEKMPTPPDLVLSTGEGDCSVRVETRAHNLDDTPFFSDNAGEQRENMVIELGAPEHEPLMLPAEAMVCASGSLSKPVVRTSVSPGYFVCNATAYRLARYFNPKKVPFGFVHLPTANCGVHPQRTSGIVHRMAAEALRLEQAKAFPNGEDCVVCEGNRGEPRGRSLPAFVCEQHQGEDVLDLLRESKRKPRQRGDIAGPGSAAAKP